MLFSVLKRVFAKNIYIGITTKTKDYLQQIEDKTKSEIDIFLKEKKEKLSPLKKFRNSLFRNSLFRMAASPLTKMKELDDKKFMNTLINTFYFKMAFRALRRNAVDVCGTKIIMNSPSPKKKPKTIIRLFRYR